mgnify:CR=1 FL=1
MVMFKDIPAHIIKLISIAKEKARNYQATIS